MDTSSSIARSKICNAIVTSGWRGSTNRDKLHKMPF